jgi:hypothetical protein
MAGMATITLDEIERHHPDVLLPPDPEFAEDYAAAVQALELSKTVVSLLLLALAAKVKTPSTTLHPGLARPKLSLSAPEGQPGHPGRAVMQV